MPHARRHAAALLLVTSLLIPAARAEGTTPGSVISAADRVRATSVADWAAAGAAFHAIVLEVESLEGPTDQRIRAFEALATLAVDLGEPRTAVAFYDRALDLRSSSVDTSTVEATARTLETLARVVQPLGDLERAEDLLRQALTIREQLHGPASPRLVPILGQLISLIEQARPDDAELETLLLRRLELADTYPLRRAAAQHFSKRGDHERAVEQYLLALKLAEADTRNGTHWRAAALSSLGSESVAVARPELAETYLSEALEARRTHYGGEHPYLARELRDLGAFYLEQERYVDAEARLAEALELKRAAYGPCDACNRDVVSLLRQAHAALGIEADLCAADEAPEASPGPDSTEAPVEQADARLRELLERRELALAREKGLEALESLERTLGADSLEVVPLLERMAEIARNLKRGDDELRLRRRQLELIERHLPADDPAIAAALRRLGHTARREKRLDEAAGYFTRESYIRERLGQNLSLASRLSELGRLHRELGDERLAGEHFLRAADLWERMAGPYAPQYLANRLDLATSYRSIGLADEATAVLEELLLSEGQRAMPRPDNLDTIREALEARNDN